MLPALARLAAIALKASQTAKMNGLGEVPGAYPAPYSPEGMDSGPMKYTDPNTAKIKQEMLANALRKKLNMKANDE